MDWIYLLLAFIIAFVIMGNILYLIFFPLIVILEWLGFAFKVANDSYQQFKRRKKLINFKDNSEPCAFEGIKAISYISQIKGYTRKADYCQYAEYTKQEVPRLFKMLDWIIHKRHYK